jgi:hypothetical protein
VQHENHLHLLENGHMQDSEEAPHHFLGHSTSTTEEHEPFPLPFVLVFAGYSFILLIDRVMFDSHALFEHGEDGHDGKGGHDHHDKKSGEGSNKINTSSIDIAGSKHLLEGGADKISHSHHHGTADPAAHHLLEKIKHTVEKIHHDKEPDNTSEREIIEEEEI